MIRLDPFVLGMADRSGRHARDYPSPLADSTSFTSGLVQLRDPVGHTRARIGQPNVKYDLDYPMDREASGASIDLVGFAHGNSRARTEDRTNAWPLATRGIVHRDQRGSGLLGVAS